MFKFNEEQIKLIKFLISGTLNTAINYAVYVLFIYLGMHHNVALACDYAFGIILGYLLNRYWTFASHENTTLSFLKYCSSYIILFLANLALLNLFIEQFNLGPNIAQLIAFTIVIGSSFFIQRFWVFKNKSDI